jgi:hypothetical protein
VTLPDDKTNGLDNDDASDSASDAESISVMQMELLRQALIEHGKRIGELEAKIDKALAEMEAVREVVRRSATRTQRIAKRLGIIIDNQSDVADSEK